jgi:PucR family transcriptional regulator, purine catabolism regulatory protein
VSDIFKIQSLEGCRVLGGKRGLNRSIRSVSIMDAPDTSLIKRGDLLLTTGYIFKDNADDQIQLINDLSAQDCSGLAIKVKRFLLEIPEVMLQEADRLDLPLIELPYDTVLSDILITLTREIIDKEGRYNKDEKRNTFLATLFSDDHIEKDDIYVKSKQFDIIPDSDFAVLYITLNSNQKSEEMISLASFLDIVNEIGRKVNAKLLGVHSQKDLSVIIQARKNSLELSSLARKTATLLGNQLSKQLANKNIRIGIGTKTTNIINIYKSYKKAKEAIFLGERVAPGGNGSVYDCTRYEPEALLQHLPEDISRQYVDGTLEVLARYDRENGTEHVQTLEAYINCGCKLADTADTLFVHRNTVKFRIAKIEELLAIDLNDSTAVFRFQLGIRIARLLGMIP